MNMFCYQCEQTANGKGCTMSGVCGKWPDVASLQDLIVHQLKGIGYFAHEARQLGRTDDDINRFTVEALFTTVTNVNFDPERLAETLRSGDRVIARARALYHDAARARSVMPDEKTYPAATRFAPAATVEAMIEQGNAVSILSFNASEDIRSLEHLLLYGLKGMAAYADHALLLDQSDDAVFAFFHEALAFLSNPSPEAAALVDICMRCGTTNIRTMELLDAGNTGRFGNPQPTPVSTGTRKGPAIVVSGHDLLDLEACCGRPRARASTSIRTVKCSRPTAIPA